MNALGAIGKNTARVRDVLQHRPNRVFFVVNRIMPYSVAQRAAWLHRILPLSAFLGAIVRHVIQISALYGFQLHSDQHLKTSIDPRLTSDAIFGQRGNRYGGEPVVPTRQGVRNMRIKKHQKFAWLIYTATSPNSRLCQLISEISRLDFSVQKLVRAQWFFKPDTIDGKHHVCLGEKKLRSLLIKQIDWIMGTIALSDLGKTHEPKMLECR